MIKSSKILISLIFLVKLEFYALAQPITWTNITSNYPALPDGVKLFKGERLSPALKAWYFNVDMKMAAIGVRPYVSNAPGGKEGITSFVPSYNAVAGINGGFFDTQGSQSFSAVVYPDAVISKNISSVVRDSKTYFLTRSFFGIKDTREMSIDWIYHFGNNVIDINTFTSPTPNQQGTPAPAPTISQGKPYYELLVGIGGGPTLLKNGAVNITYDQEVFWGSGVGYSNQDSRTAVGYTNDNHVIMLVADGRQTLSNGLSLPELAQVMIDLGCIEAMNLDGGGSTQMAVGSQLLNLPEGGTFQRPIPNMLAIVKNDSVPFLPPVYFNKKIDTGDNGCTIIGTNWTNSIISGYWGTTPSIRNLRGNGSEYVSFKPNVIKSATYEIFGWWTTAIDRCTDTPFIIRHKNGTDTVRVDQTKGRYKWNYIGSYPLSADSTDEIIISNGATNGSYVIADAIRLISYDSSTVTSVQDDFGGNNLPKDFILEQNYPNPFNPNTKISWHSPVSSWQSLKVYDVLGNEIVTIVNEEKPAGSYEASFDGKNLSSGIYFYKLSTSNFSEVRKMILLR
jgi:hypothetical protein